jgi:hypothetical protein
MRPRSRSPTLLVRAACSSCVGFCLNPSRRTLRGSARCAPGGSSMASRRSSPSPGQSPRQFVSHYHCRAPALVSRSNVPAVIRKSPIYAVFPLSTGTWDMDSPMPGLTARYSQVPVGLAATGSTARRHGRLRHQIVGCDNVWAPGEHGSRKGGWP